jgi:hypothetical protein
MPEEGFALTRFYKKLLKLPFKPVWQHELGVFENIC